MSKGLKIVLWIVAIAIVVLCNGSFGVPFCPPDSSAKTLSFSSLIFLLIIGILGKPYSGSLQTSTQVLPSAIFSNSPRESSIALLELPQAGKTVSKRLRDSSR